MEYQAYHLNGEKKGTIEISNSPFYRGYRSNTMVTTTRDQKGSGQKGQYYYEIHALDGKYCIASTFNILESETQALKEAKSAGLKPYPEER